MTLVNRDCLFLLWNLDSFQYFSRLIALVRISSTMMSRSVEKIYPCHFPEFGGKASNLLPLNVILAVSFSYMSFIGLKKFFLLLICWVCWGFFSSFISFFFVSNKEKISDFCQILFLHLFRWSCYFCFLFYWYITLTDFLKLNHSCVPWINSTWS